jgi:uncharacterized membrane protein YfcA
MNVPKGKFVGLLALLMIPASALRLPLVLSYGSAELVTPLGMILSSLESQLAEKLSQKHIRYLTVALLVVISFNLIRTAGL